MGATKAKYNFLQSKKQKKGAFSSFFYIFSVKGSILVIF
jgi:hypothetical protein